MKKIDSKKLVERYYKNYIDYKNLFKKLDKPRKELKEKFKPFVESQDAKSEDFKQVAKQFFVDRSIQWSDLLFYKDKFLKSCDFHLLTNEEKLSDEVSKEYVELNKSEYKPFFQVVDGKFLENKKSDIDNIPQQEFDKILKEITYLYNNQ